VPLGSSRDRLNWLRKETTLVSEAELIPNSANPKTLEEMTTEEMADFLHQKGMESGNRYGGNPELLLKEQPHRDFRNPAGQTEEQAARRRFLDRVDQALQSGLVTRRPSASAEKTDPSQPNTPSGNSAA
jgi:hypothetical protein